MNDANHFRFSVTRFLVGGAAIIVILAGLKAAQTLVTPFFMAVFFAMVLMPPLRWLKSKGQPDWFALLTLSFVVFLFGIGVIVILSSSLTSFANRLPEYQKRLNDGVSIVDGWIDVAHKEFEKAQGSLRETVTAVVPLPPMGDEDEVASEETQQETKRHVTDAMTKFVNPAMAIMYVRLAITEILNIASVTFLVAVMVVFMLIEATQLPLKVQKAFGDRLSDKSLRAIADDTWKYMKIKTIISFVTGLATWIGLWFFGVEYSLLWGLLIFFLNFIPNIGPIIASIPPILLAIFDQGLAMGLIVTGYLVFINWVLGYGVEPRYLGQGLGLSELVVLLSLIFWGWLLGPVGMFLSAPLTMVVKIVLQNNPKTEWVAILMSNRT